jgi:hypothetical protein
MKKTMIVQEDLVIHPDAAIGTIAECIQNREVTGDLIDYDYFVLNGRRVLLGHHDFPGLGGDTEAVEIGGSNVNAIFVTQGNRKRNVTTWEELRTLLAEKWVIGTERRPGVKIWFASTGRNSRRDPNKIFVARI